MSSKRSKYLAVGGSRGDTIVEVLLAIAVVGMVLGAAYVSAGRSYNNTRQSQERGEAAKYVEGQLERLKEAAKTDPTMFTVPAGNTFCMDDALARRVSTDPACRVGPGSRYQLSIQRAGNNFTAIAQWQRFGAGTLNDEVKIVYRLYP